MLDAPTTDQPLIDAAVNPDDAAVWKTLHETYHAPLLRLCDRSGLSPDEAEEVAQQVLIKLSQRLAKAKFNWEATSLRGWLIEMSNRAIFEAHRRSRRGALPPQVRAVIQEWLPPALAPGSDGGSRERLESHLWTVCLARVRNAVKARQWQIFEAYALQGHSAAEVARRFNTTGFNVRVIRHRMVARIRKDWRQLASCPLPESEK